VVPPGGPVAKGQAGGVTPKINELASKCLKREISKARTPGMKEAFNLEKTVVNQKGSWRGGTYAGKRRKVPKGASNPQPRAPRVKSFMGTAIQKEGVGGCVSKRKRKENKKRRNVKKRKSGDSTRSGGPEKDRAWESYKKGGHICW